MASVKPHPLNWRTHSREQKAAVVGLMEEVGLARSTLAYIADADKHLGDAAPLTLIDGHGRREWIPDQEIEIEILDVNDEEARKLLLSLDPTAALAGKNEDALNELLAMTDTDNEALRALWHSAAETPESNFETPKIPQSVQETYGILVTCKNERQQTDLLNELDARGIECKALM